MDPRRRQCGGVSRAPRVRLGLAAALASAVVVVTCAVVGAGASDGGEPGPLRPGLLASDRPAEGWTSFYAAWDQRRPGAAVTTYAVDVCLTEPAPVVLTGLAPRRVEGARPRLVAAVVHRARGLDDLPSSQPGDARRRWPDARPLAEAPVYDLRCGSGRPTRARPWTQLVVSLAPGPGAARRGSAWDGVVVGYRTADGADHELEVPMTIGFCGRETEACG